MTGVQTCALPIWDELDAVNARLSETVDGALEVGHGGSGTWLGFQVLPDSIARISIMTQAPGAFFCYGVLMAGCIWLEGKLDARIERKSCCDIDNLKKEG